MKAIGYTTTVIVTMILSMLYSGYALSVLWGWFIVPTFSVAALSIPAAIGLAMVVSYLTHQTKTEKSEDGFAEVLIKGILMAVLKPSFALAFGWVVHLWM